jgi:hypothetical protein
MRHVDMIRSDRAPEAWSRLGLPRRIEEPFIPPKTVPCDGGILC